MTAAFIMIELEVKLPEKPRLTPHEASLFISQMRQVASAGAVAALSAVMSPTSTVEAEPIMFQ